MTRTGVAWKRAAEGKEADEKRRVVYRDMALVFAELTKGLVVWQRGLEGWMMKESQYINRWRGEGVQIGELRRARADLLEVLAARTGGQAPDAIRLAIEGTNDPDTLRRWLVAASTAGSYADFQAAMRQTG